MVTPINRTWHEQHRMPRQATLDERIRWHTEHAKECSCRPIPERLLAEIKKLEPLRGDVASEPGKQPGG